jgi:hypothetical protein
MLRNSLRERYEKKRKERQDILGSGSLTEAAEQKKSLIFGEGRQNNLLEKKFNPISFCFKIQKLKNV